MRARWARSSSNANSNSNTNPNPNSNPDPNQVGQVEFGFYPNAAPVTVAHILKL